MQPVEGDAVPLTAGRPPPRLIACQLLLGVIDQGGQLIPLGLGEGGGKQFVQLFPHDTGGGVEDDAKTPRIPRGRRR